MIDVPVRDQDYSIDYYIDYYIDHYIDYYAAGSQEIILGGDNQQEDDAGNENL